jgi:hypothetical protein
MDRHPMSETILIREWDADLFHRRVLDLEAEGYQARLESYQVVPEMNPETGEIIHLHTVELRKLSPEKQPRTESSPSE